MISVGNMVFQFRAAVCLMRHLVGAVYFRYWSVLLLGAMLQPISRALRMLCVISTSGREEKTTKLTLKLIWIWVALLSFGKYIFFHYLTICLCIPYTVMIMFMEMKLFHRTSIEISAFLFSSTISHFDTLTRVISVIYPV